MSQWVDYSGTWWASLPCKESISSLEPILSAIDPEDLFYDVISKNKPIEAHHHVTLCMGLPEQWTTEWQNLIRRTKAFSVTCTTLGYFTNPPKEIQGKMRGWDVLWVKPEVEGTPVQSMHQWLVDTHGVKQIHDTYHPHVTLCYLKYGTAQKYVETLKFQLLLQFEKIEWKKFRDKTAPVKHLFLDSDDSVGGRF